MFGLGISAIFGFAKMLINPIDHIAGKIAEYKIAEQKARTDEQRILAQERISALEARRDVMVAEARHPLNALTRTALASPVVFILWKVMVWDKSVGGVTLMSSDIWHVCWIVLGFYFIDSTATRVTRILKA